MPRTDPVAEHFAAQHTRQAQLAADAARLARSPTAGPFLFGALVTALADENRLSYLSAAVTSAEVFAAAGHSPAADAAEIRQTMTVLSGYATRWPGLFGKAGREAITEARRVLAQAADGLDASDDVPERDIL